jgi:hypothetical protein
MVLGDSDLSLLKSQKFLPQKASWSKLSNNRLASSDNHVSFSGALGLNIAGQSLEAISRKINTARERALGSTQIEVVNSIIVAAIINSWDVEPGVAIGSLDPQISIVLFPKDSSLSHMGISTCSTHGWVSRDCLTAKEVGI